MMFNQEFSSTEELFYEASADEALNFYQESQMRFSDNVVYVPHVLSPVMILEYIPVIYSFQTYEPYLINRYQVMYTPFLRQVSYTYFVPYYYSFTAPEVYSSYTPAVFPSYTQHEDNTPPNSYPESIVDQATSDEIESEDDTSSMTGYSDDTSVLSLPGSEQDSSQDFVYIENIDRLPGECDEDNESNVAREYTHESFGAADEYPVNEVNSCSYPESILNQDPCDELESENDIKSSISYSGEKSTLTLSSSVPSSSYEHLEFDSTQEQSESLQGSISTKNNDFFVDKHEIAREYPERLYNDVSEDVSNESEGCSLSLFLLDKGKDPPDFDSPGDYIGHSPFDKDRDVEDEVSSVPLFDYVQTPDSLPVRGKVEVSLLKSIKQDRHLSPEQSENHDVFDNDVETCASSAFSVEYVDKCPDKKGLQYQERSPLKNEKITRYDGHTSSHMPVLSHETPLQMQGSSDKTDVEAPDPFDYVINENKNETGGDPEITLQDVLTLQECWSVKKEECVDKKRNNELYRSALQGDIHPRKSLPDVGTMDTIFEDLPYPVNQPYDDGQEDSDEYFDLPALEVERSTSSTTTLLPKKKRFQNTRQFFSGLFRCFRPPKMKKGAQ